MLGGTAEGAILERDHGDKNADLVISACHGAFFSTLPTD
jgi:hypothetical protein